MSDLKFLSDCKDEELIELRERNARLVAAVTEINNEAVSKIQQFKDSNARLVAALGALYVILHNSSDTAYDSMISIIDEALQQSTEKP